MAKGKKSIFDYFKIPDDDEEYEDDDYIFDEDDDDDYDEPPVKKAPKAAPKVTAKPAFDRAPKETKKYTSFGSPAPTSTASDKLVSFDGGADRYAEKASRSRTPKSSEVFVIKPQEFDDAQTVADFLKRGKAIVINMEGLQLESAQRIIDFIGGACYGMGGELKAISASIFIAVPNNIEVSGDLREEILSSSAVSPFLG